MKKAEKKATYFIMVVINALFYFLPGKWVSIERDSEGYLGGGGQGVMPGYPAFLQLMKRLFGEEEYLNAAVVAQCVLAILVTIIFIYAIDRRIHLKSCECLLLLMATMLPFSIYLPEVGITHQVMTEGIAYSLYYVFFTCCLEALWTKKGKWLVISEIISILLVFVRSQLVILQVITVFLMLYYIKKKAKKLTQTIVCVIAGMGILGFVSFFLLYGENTEKKQEYIKDENTQIDTLIICRGLFEGEESDADLFEDKSVKEIYIRSYHIAEQKEELYSFVEPGLYMWEKLVSDKLGKAVDQAIYEYDEQYPEVREFNEAQIDRIIGITLLREHFGRYLYHTFRLMLPSLIASVFFQIRPIYLLCHVIAVMIYLFAIAGCVILRKQHKSPDVVMLMGFSIFSSLVFVIVTNIVFIGLQRYVVYGMGIFYCALYLVVRELAKQLWTKIQWEKKHDLNQI